MAEILTNNKNYYDIADTIRQMKNVNTTYKPREMASALKDIYSNEVEGVPPLSFESNGMPLIDYRIDGASGGVGDRTSNLFDYKAWKNSITGVSNNGNIIFNNDDSFTITANNTNDVFTLGYSNYKLSAKPGTNYYFNFSSNNTNAGLVYIFENGINDNEHKHIAFNQSGKYASFTTQQDTTYIIFRFGVYAANTEITYKNISLVEGNSAPSNYEPYGYKVPVVVNGKNLLKPDGTPTTIRGVSWSYREDGAVVGERVSSNENISDFTLINSSIFKPGSYIFSRFDTESTPGSSTYQSNISINGVSHWGTGNYLFVLNEASTIRVVLRVYPDFTGTAIFKPMIRLSSIQESNYEAYIEPTTTNIYLDEPLCNVNNNIDYIDFSSQSKMKKTGTIEFVNSSNWKIESDHNFYYDIAIGTASPKSLVVSNKVPSLVTSVAEARANQYTENIWISAGQRVNLWLADIDHTLTALQNWLLQEPLIVQYQLQNHSEISVNLPAISTIEGTNTLSIDTTVQPSNVYIQARKDSDEVVNLIEFMEEEI